ncbi:MAG: hypothetical protein QME79_12480 [Bacillota bacterium]|nr:hypothetical protein [Bacillota bacterium]
MATDLALKAKALAIAEATTIREASLQTGVPEGTIKRWRFENRTEPREPNRTNRTPKKMEPVAAAAVEKAVEEAGEYIAERLKRLADDLYGLAEKAARKIDVAISDADELPKGKAAESHDRDGAAWLRSLVGVLSQAVEKAQLLSGKPTGRIEGATTVTRREEYHVRIEQVLSDPDARGAARDLWRRAHAAGG